MVSEFRCKFLRDNGFPQTICLFIFNTSRLLQSCLAIVITARCVGLKLQVPFIAIGISIGLTAAAAVQAEDLPTRDGLLMWIDVSQQAAARKSASLPPIGPLQPIDFLIDSSGNRRNATQLLPEKRPIFLSDGEAACLKLDGIDDFLSITGPGGSTTALTVFVLAAPKTNNGNFTGLFATSQTGANDYTTGLNFDFGPNPTPDLSVLNAESAGATGFKDLLMPGIMNAASRPFGDFHVFTVRSKAGKPGTEVFLDGFKGGAAIGRNRSSAWTK